MPQSPVGHLIRSWRTTRGWSQLALALAAHVSPRQLSFIETGRGHPTPGTLDRLADALAITPHERTLLMQAAGLDARPDGSADPGIAESLERSLAFLLDQHEPYPAWVIDRYTDVRMQNRAMHRILPRLLPPGYTPADGLPNLIRMLFDPDGLRFRIANWERLARTAVQRLKLAVVTHPRDAAMRALYDDALGSDARAAGWTRRDEGPPLDWIVPVRVRTHHGADLQLATAFTVLASPDGVTIQELYIQKFFPADDFARTFLHALASSPEAEAARPTASRRRRKAKPAGAVAVRSQCG